MTTSALEIIFNNLIHTLLWKNSLTVFVKTDSTKLISVSAVINDLKLDCYTFLPRHIAPSLPTQHCPSEQVLGLLCWARQNCNPCFGLPSPNCVFVLYIIFFFPQLPHMLLLSPVSIQICSNSLPVVLNHGYPLESPNILHHFSPHCTPSPKIPNTQAKIRICVIFTNR